MLPLAVRFRNQPGLLLVAGALARSLLHPRPQLGTAALWVVSRLAGCLGLWHFECL